MLKRAIILSAAIAIVSACSDGLSDTETSGAFGFPVPAGINVSETKSSEFGEFYVYHVSASYEALLEWYSARLIKGQDRGDWQWCAFLDSEISGGRWRIYSYIHPNGSSVEVSLLKNSRQTGGQVAITITEQTNGARTKDCTA